MRPTQRALYWVSAWTALGFAHAVLMQIQKDADSSFLKMLFQICETAWQATGITLLLLAIVDYLMVRRAAPPTVNRILPSHLSVGHWYNVKLQLKPASRRQANTRLTIHDLYDTRIAIAHHAETSLRFPGDAVGITTSTQLAISMGYRLKATHRGDLQFTGTHVLQVSPFGLWAKRHTANNQQTVKVYPDFARVMQYQALATEHHVEQLGIRKRPKRGEGMEFHQLREYRSGDSLRQVDWKATSRKKKLISREYQDERDQQIVFLLDCGRRMRSKDDELSHFDHALNAMLLLSHIALKHGDAVGMMTFGGSERWLSPQKSLNTSNQLLNRIYDIHPTTNASDFTTATQRLNRLQRKRALIILITNIREEDQHDIAPALRLLRKKHLVLLANMREDILDQTLKHTVSSLNDAFRYLGAIEHIEQRRQLSQRQQQQGILMVDSRPSDLQRVLVNQYHTIKASGLL